MRVTARKVLQFLFFCFFCFLTLFSTTRFGIANSKIAARENYFDSMRIYSVDKGIHVGFAMIDLRKGNMGSPSVRLLSMTSSKNSAITCRFPNGYKVNSTVYEFSENHMQRYGTYYLSCAFPATQDYDIDTIEVSSNITAGFQTIPIAYRIPDTESFEKYTNLYSICVPKLFGNSFKADRLVEFVELNRLFGVESITLYVDKKNLSADLSRTVEYYGMEGILKVRDVQLPFDDNLIWYHAQLLTITDCLVRHTGKSKFVAFHDLDEFLVPLISTHAPTYFKQVMVGNISSLRVKTSYMNLIDHNVPITTRNIATQSNLDNTLTKCVLRPEHVFEQGIHHTSRVIQDYMNITSGDSEHLRVFHYKTHASNIENKYLASTYGETLQKNFDQVVKRLGL